MNEEDGCVSMAMPCYMYQKSLLVILNCTFFKENQMMILWTQSKVAERHRFQITGVLVPEMKWVIFCERGLPSVHLPTRGVAAVQRRSHGPRAEWRHLVTPFTLRHESVQPLRTKRGRQRLFRARPPRSRPALCLSILHTGTFFFCQLMRTGNTSRERILLQ